MHTSFYKIRYITFMFIFAITTAKARAQQPVTQHQAGITMGIITATDTLLSGVKLKGRAVSAGYTLSRTGEKRKTGIGITYTNDQYNNTGVTIAQHHFDLRFTDGYRIFPKLSKPAVYIGYSLTSHSAYAPAVGQRTLSWNSYNMIGLYQSYVYKWKDQSLSLDINIPLAGVAYRNKAGNNNPGEAKAFNEVLSSLYDNPSFTALHNNHSADISLNYTKQAGKRLLLGFHYKMAYRNWKGNNPSTSSSNALGISMALLRRK